MIPPRTWAFMSCCYTTTPSLYESRTTHSGECSLLGVVSLGVVQVDSFSSLAGWKTTMSCDDGCDDSWWMSWNGVRVLHNQRSQRGEAHILQDSVLLRDWRCELISVPPIEFSKVTSSLAIRLGRLERYERYQLTQKMGIIIIDRWQRIINSPILIPWSRT
jgi:hypothetical protein